MTHTIPNLRPALQRKNDENRVISRRKCHGGLSSNQHSTYKRVRRAIRACGGCCDWDVDRLAHYCGISPRQFQRDRRVLVTAGMLLVIERKESATRNLTNLYMLPDLAPVLMGDTDGGEIQELLETNTTTLARENPRVESIPDDPAPHPSPTRQQWEARRNQDRSDHHRMRERYSAVGESWLAEKRETSETNRRWWREGRGRWDGGRDYRLEKAVQRTRRAVAASVGVWDGVDEAWGEGEESKFELERRELDAQIRARREAEEAEVQARMNAGMEEKRRQDAEFEAIADECEARLRVRIEAISRGLRCAAKVAEEKER